MVNSLTSIFFSLIRLGLGITQSLSFKEITDKEWSAILSMAHKQTMLGVMMDAIDRLPEDMSRPPKTIVVKLVKMGVNMVLKTVDIRSPKTVISVHFSSSKPMAMQIY